VVVRLGSYLCGAHMVPMQHRHDSAGPPTTLPSEQPHYRYQHGKTTTAVKYGYQSTSVAVPSH